MNIIYIIAAIILFIVSYVIQKHFRYLLKNWKEVLGTSSKFICILAMTTNVFAIICSLFLIYWTIDCWYISNFTSRPKPHFLIIFFLGIFSIGIFMGLSQFFSGISNLKEKIKHD